MIPIWYQYICSIYLPLRTDEPMRLVAAGMQRGQKPPHRGLKRHEFPWF